MEGVISYIFQTVQCVDFATNYELDHDRAITGVVTVDKTFWAVLVV